tara:strand:+ start:3097 stop:4683 length:1587 start_codon:yes stop_codon:yes gene_type:complete
MSEKLSSQLKKAKQLLKIGDLISALAVVEELKNKHDDVPDVWALDGEIAIRQQRIKDAMTAVDQAAKLEPDNAERHIQRARCYIVAGDTDEALKSALLSINLGVTRLDHLLVLGGVLVRCDEHLKALDVFLKAKETSKGNVNVHRGLASVYRFLGELEKAEQACNEVIRLDPHDYEMIGLRSSLKKQTKEDNHINQMVQLERSGIKNWRGAVHVAYALSKEYEDLQEYKLSFKWLKYGANIKRQHLKYDFKDDIKIFDTLKTAFSSDQISNLSEGGDLSTAPIFVLGMPRTGSTLIERIISSHSLVQNAGELSSFSFAMMNQLQIQGNEKISNRLSLAENTVKLSMEELGKEYLKLVEPIRDDSSRFVDKLPMNSLNIGLIFLALPNAKIVHVIRNPLDSCYAIYKFLFKNGYPFSYDLKELALYYIEYYQLMQHWRNVLPKGHIYDIQYEEVVEDLSTQARQLIKFLDLPWEDACEEFHTNRQASTTGSASQVRRPIYKSSVGKWRFFEKELQSLRATLEDAGVPIN